MKTTSIVNSLFIAFLAAFIIGCGGLGNMEKHIEELGATAEPEPLIVRGDSVELNISGKFPEKYFHKKVIAEATPVLVHGDSNTPFKMQGFAGEDAASNYEKIPYESGKSFSYTDRIAYDPVMENQGVLELRISGSKGNKTAEFDPLVIGSGVITTPYLIQSDDKPIMATDNYQRVLSYNQEGVINYAYNSSRVASKETRDEDVMALKDLVAMAAEADSVTITGCEVKAYASPEGEITLNEDLAQERAESANAVVIAEMKRKKILPEGDSFFVNTPKGEDWEGFKELMQASEIEDKNLILRVLEQYQDKTKREQEIKNIAKTYKEIEKDILPSLRRSQIMISYDVEGYTDDELRAVSVSNPDTLTVEELLYSATLTDDDAVKMDIYQATERLFGDDPRAINNIGVLFLQQNRINDAESKFNRAIELDANFKPALNNAAIIHRIKGERSDALDKLAQAAGAGDEVSYNKGIVQIQNGDYAGAISNMGNMNSFNLALAKMLNGDNSGAKTALENSGDDSAVADYLMAIISARMNDGAGVTSSLQSAIGKDGSLKEKAMEDLEFRNFKDAMNF
ncbi:MAG: hypothetical protein AAF193_01245 [Bacteroidota bacterium]